MYHYFRKPPHGRPWVSGLSSHIALYVATYPASEKKNRTQVNCTSFWGEQLWTCTFFFEVGQKKWEQHVFGLFLGGDVFETWYFLGSWCSIFQEFNLSIFQPTKMNCMFFISIYQISINFAMSFLCHKISKSNKTIDCFRNDSSFNQHVWIKYDHLIFPKDFHSQWQVASWWFQPIWKILVKLEIFPT